MVILGIETSCDETAAAILQVRQQRTPATRAKLGAGHGKETNKQRKSSLVSRSLHFSVLSNIVSSQVKIHAKYGGIVPEVAARRHVEVILPILGQALGRAKINFKVIDAIAVTAGPGLVTSLLVGAEVARVLAYVWKKPLVAVNHIEGHIYANWLPPICEIRNPKFEIRNKYPMSNIRFPILCLVVSGGHTELILMRGHGKYKIVGETRDDAAGECFDKTAKILGLGYPGGPAIAWQAERWKSEIRNPKSEINPKFQIPKLPRPMIGSPDFDFSFAGLKTAVLYSVRDLKNKYKMQEIVPAMTHEIQEVIVDVLVAKTIRAAKKFGVKTVMLAGGVSANKRLRERFVAAMRSELPNIKYQIPDTKYCTDNAAMIAVAGYFHAIKKNFTPWQKLKVDPNQSLS